MKTKKAKTNDHNTCYVTLCPFYTAITNPGLFRKVACKSVSINGRMGEMFAHNYASINVIPGGRGGRVGVGILTFCPNFLSKTTPLGQRILSKKHKNPHPRAGELCQMFLQRGKLFILGIRRDQTRQKNCTSLSLRKTEIILPINSTKSNSHKY